ncbi:MAG: DUF2318 domain-containing protein [Ignavibacteriae bacterium]|nr:DUF2318 domain-containing protein [Ignavibacteriota bacterium]
MKNYTAFLSKISGIAPTIILIMIILNLNSLSGLDRRHPVSEISTTPNYYSYNYIINSTTMKVIDYFIVKDGSGNIKSAFNACEVCYKADKGYSQRGDKMHCNNCGNEYPIENLGTQGQGGCWPGYLPHEISGDEIVIQISDLENGEYLFPAEPYSGVSDIKNLPTDFKLFVKENELEIRMPSAIDRNIRIFDMNSHILSSLKCSANELSINTFNLSCGIYILVVEDEKNSYYSLFNVVR